MYKYFTGVPLARVGEEPEVLPPVVIEQPKPFNPPPRNKKSPTPKSRKSFQPVPTTPLRVNHTPKQEAPQKEDTPRSTRDPIREPTPESKPSPKQTPEPPKTPTVEPPEERTPTPRKTPTPTPTPKTENEKTPPTSARYWTAFIVSNCTLQYLNNALVDLSLFNPVIL